jgi:flagellar basal body-associated protein FliL
VSSALDSEGRGQCDNVDNDVVDDDGRVIMVIVVVMIMVVMVMMVMVVMMVVTLGLCHKFQACGIWP